MTRSLATAIAHHRAGRLAEAEEIYREILAADPEHAEALHLLGLVACQVNQLEAAEALIVRASALVPGNAEFLLNLGEVQRRRGKLEAAAASLRRAVEAEPGNAFGHYNLGVTLGALAAGGAEERAEFREEAIRAYQRAIALQPAFPEAFNNLGLSLHAAGRLDEAIGAYRRALELKPGYAEAETNLGKALWEAGRLQEAVTAFEKALALAPDFVAAHTNLGLAQRALGRRGESVASLRRAADLMPGSAEAQRELSISLLENGMAEEAERAARQAIGLAPESPEAHRALALALAARRPAQLPEAVAAYERALALKADAAWAFELASLRGETGTRTAPDAYVRTLFDAYVPRFEAHLVGELGYRAPEDLWAAVLQRATLPASRKWDVLDLGCGTGLCGALFRPHARLLVGVDLAPKMIERSRERGIYDELVTGHITPAMLARPAAFDVIVAGDVFIYVGDLGPVLPAAAAALRGGGVLAFSLERYDGPGFILHQRQRFAHSLEYIRGLAGEAGLEEVSVTPTALRKDVAPGWIVLLRRVVG